MMLNEIKEYTVSVKTEFYSSHLTFFKLIIYIYKNIL